MSLQVDRLLIRCLIAASGLTILLFPAPSRSQDQQSQDLKSQDQKCEFEEKAVNPAICPSGYGVFRICGQRTQLIRCAEREKQDRN
jgi:hypothetical protein